MKDNSIHFLVRIAFWVVGAMTGGILAYTTRFYFTFGDALCYAERGENLFRAQWSSVINLSEGPMYPLFMGLGQALLGTDPQNEIPGLKIVNFVIFLFAMGACDLLVSLLCKKLKDVSSENERPLPLALFRGLIYAFFLVTALALIRVRLSTPDMLLLCLICLCVSAVLWIRRNPGNVARYVLLGILVGVGYLVKTFMMVFSPAFFCLAALCSKSLRTAVPRVLVAVLAMAAVVAPMVVTLSLYAGRLTYGDLGTVQYAERVAGRGAPIRPQILCDEPRIYLMDWDVNCTRPYAYDDMYWRYGPKPEFHLVSQGSTILRNVAKFLTMEDWLGIVLVLFLFQVTIGGIRTGPLRPISPFWVVFLSGLGGVALYCVVWVDMRFVAPFLFLCLAALPMSVRYREDRPKSKPIVISIAAVLLVGFVGILIHSVIDQSLRAMGASQGKPSYSQVYAEESKASEFAMRNGLRRGDTIAVSRETPGYWARMAGLRIRAELWDESEFLRTTKANRDQAAEKLKQNGFKARVVHNSQFRKLMNEGWRYVEGTRDYYMLLLAPQPR